MARASGKRVIVAESQCLRDQCHHRADQHRRTRLTRVASSGKLAQCTVDGCGCRAFARRTARAE